MRTFSAEGTVKKAKSMKGKICLQPFTNVDIHSDGGVRCCSESWMRSEIGNVHEASLDEIWNGDTIKKIRQTVLDGDYGFCDWHQCPFYCNEEHYLFTMDELKDPSGLDPVRRDRVEKHRKWLEPIYNKEVQQSQPPANYNFAYDESCNLACPSCRTGLIGHIRGEEYEIRKTIQDGLVNYLNSVGMEHVGRINISGSGEPFASKLFKEFLFTFDGTRHPGLDINIQSNGLLFSETAWVRMKKIHGNINEVLISIDASTAETYSKVRVNGDFSTLIHNLEFISGLAQVGKIRRFMLAFVVQQRNYHEMQQAVALTKKLNAERIVFNLLNDWETWSKQDYSKHAVWKNFHPEFTLFLDHLKSPIFDEPVVDLGNVLEYRKLAVDPNALVICEVGTR